MKFSNIFSFFKRNKKKVDILDYKTAIDYIINNEVSISRYGDGEFFLIMDRDIPFQTASSKLKERLIEVLTSENPNIVAERESVEIGQNCYIGQNFKCYSSDFHGIKKEDRNNPEKIKTAPVKIGNGVFIGNDVTI